MSKSRFVILTIIICLITICSFGNSTPRQDKIKNLYAEYARQYKGYSFIETRDLEIVELNKIPFIRTAVYKVCFKGIHPREYFYFVISGNKIEPISSPDYMLHYNTLSRFIVPGRLKTYNNAKKMASLLADVKNYGYPDIIVNNIEEIKLKIFPHKYDEVKKFIKPLKTRTIGSGVVITFYTLGRFDGAFHFDTIMIKNDSIEYIKEDLLKDVTSRHALE